MKIYKHYVLTTLVLLVLIVFSFSMESIQNTAEANETKVELECPDGFFPSTYAGTRYSCWMPGDSCCMAVF